MPSNIDWYGVDVNILRMVWGMCIYSVYVFATVTIGEENKNKSEDV